MKHNPRRPRIFAAGIASVIVSLIGVILQSPLQAAEAANATHPASPLAMEMNAVTLELDCHDGATEGEFHPIGARMLEATVWDAAPWIGPRPCTT